MHAAVRRGLVNTRSALSSAAIAVATNNHDFFNSLDLLKSISNRIETKNHGMGRIILTGRLNPCEADC